MHPGIRRVVRPWTVCWIEGDGNFPRLQEADDLSSPGHSWVDHGTGQPGAFGKQQATGQAVGSQYPATVLHDAILKRDGGVEIVLEDEKRLTA